MISGSTMMLNMDPTIINALREDVTSEDVSTNAIMRQPQLGKAELICKQDGIICGLDVFARVFEILEEEAHFETTYADGDEVKKGQLIGVIYADIRHAADRVSAPQLNFLQRMTASRPTPQDGEDSGRQAHHAARHQKDNTGSAYL